MRRSRSGTLTNASDRMVPEAFVHAKEQLDILNPPAQEAAGAALRLLGRIRSAASPERKIGF